MEFEVVVQAVHAGVALLVGLLQCGLIGWGLWTMNRANHARAKREDQRHEEAMITLRTLIERTAPAA